MQIEKSDIKNNILYRKELWEQNPCNPNYWLDFNEATPNNDGTFTIVCRPVKIPYVNIIEMFCDFIGAGQSYEKEKWTCETPWNYWQNKCEGKRAMHPESEYLFKKLLWNLKIDGLDQFLNWYNESKNFLEELYNRGKIFEV